MAPRKNPRLPHSFLLLLVHVLLIAAATATLVASLPSASDALVKLVKTMKGGTVKCTPNLASLASAVCAIGIDRAALVATIGVGRAGVLRPHLVLGSFASVLFTRGAELPMTSAPLPFLGISLAHFAVVIAGERLTTRVLLKASLFPGVFSLCWTYSYRVECASITVGPRFFRVLEVPSPNFFFMVAGVFTPLTLNSLYKVSVRKFRVLNNSFRLKERLDLATSITTSVTKLHHLVGKFFDFSIRK